MKRLLLLLFLFSQVCNSQTKYDKNAECKKTKNLSESQRLSNFPFSKASQVKFISFESKKEEVTGNDLIEHLNSLRLEKDFFNSLSYTEVVTLNSLQVNRLTDVVYNYSYKKSPYTLIDIKCYEPRNAIIFLDSNNIIIAYIEICFGCNHFRSSNAKLDLGEYCSEKYEMLKSIFKDCKIEYGITRTE